MTSIKPKDGAPSPSATAPTSAGGAATGTERAGASFREALQGPERSAATGGAAASGGATAAGTDPIAELARAIQSGSLTVDQALDHLVERAAGLMAGRLSSSQRDELRTVIASALEDDPALRALRENLG